MNKIKNIIFDLGGVILDIDFNKAQEAFEKLGVTNFAQYFDVGHAASFFREHESGSMNDEDFLSSLQKLAANSLEPERVQAAWNALLISFPPERIEFLKKLKTKYRLFLLSNTNGIHVNAFEKMYSNAFPDEVFTDLFEKIYYSHQVKMRKPNKEIYEYVLKDKQLKPDETLFVDDALVNVEAARKAGIEGIHLQPGMSILDIPSMLDASY